MPRVYRLVHALALTRGINRGRTNWTLAGILTLITDVLLDAFTELPISLHWLTRIAAGLVALAGFAVWLKTRSEEPCPYRMSHGT